MKNFLLAIRPKTLFASLSPVLVGSALAYRVDGVAFSYGVFFLTAVTAILLQIESNLANDYFDFKKGADTKARLGPTRVTSAGLVKPETMKKWVICNAIVAFVLGLGLVKVGGLPILAVGLCSIAASILYTAGPLPLSYLGLGDVFVVLFFGVIAVGGTYFLQTHALPEAALWAGLCVGLLCNCILVVNNCRDYREDLGSNKKTLIVRFGEKFGRGLYAVCLFLPSVLVVSLAYSGRLPFLTILVLLLMPLQIVTFKKFLKTKPEGLNPFLAQSGKILFLFSLLFSMGCLSDSILKSFSS